MTIYNGSPGAGAAQEPDTMYCANHPTVPTYLRCGQCGKPICAKCRISTPVGYKCLNCAQISVLPTYAVDSTSYVKAGVAGFGVATIVGLLWGFLPGYEFWAALIMGIGVGEAVSAAVNMKRGPGLQAVGIAAVVWGIIFSRVVLGFIFNTNPEWLEIVPGNVNAQVVELYRSGGDLVSLFTATDLTSLIFLILALGLTFFRLR